MSSTKDYIYAVCLFSVSSVGMMLGNKLAVVSLPLPCTLVYLQSIGTLMLLFAFFRHEIEDINFGCIVGWIPIAILFTLMLFSSLKSFLYVNVSTVIILRNINSIVTTVVEFFVLGERVNAEIILSECVILLGAYLYGCKNSNFNWVGFFWIFLNLSAQVSYGITLKHYMTRNVKYSTMSKFSMSFLNNALALPMIFLFIAGTEANKVRVVFSEISVIGWFWVVFTCFLGFLISTSGFGLQKLVSATTFIIVNNLVKFFNIVLGVLFLGDRMHTVDGIGCFIALTGGAWYSYALYKFKQREPVTTSSTIGLLEVEDEEMKTAPREREPV